MPLADLTTILRAAQHAQDGHFAKLSIRQKLVAAVLLNRPEWVATMGFTLVDAIEQIGPQWLALLPTAARTLAEAPSRPPPGRR